MKCPRCDQPLQKCSCNNTAGFYCGSCKGIAVTVSGLRTLGVDPENVYNIWLRVNSGKAGSELSCPECGNPLQIIKLDNSGDIFYIDVCRCCQLIWFDCGELDKIPVNAAADPNQLPPQAKEIIAINNIRSLNYSPSETTPSWFEEHLGIDPLWCSAALRLLVRLILKI